MSGDQTRAEREIVRAFIAERSDLAAALGESSGATYWHTQGRAAARRELAERLGLDPYTGGPTPEGSRPPAEAAAGGLAAEKRGTGVGNPHTRPEAVQWGQGADCPHRPEWHCEAHGECRGCECGCDTVNPPLDLESAVWTFPNADLIPAALVESDPGIRGGEPVMKGTRVPAEDIAGLLADGLPWGEVHEFWPSVPLPEGTDCTGSACGCTRPGGHWLKFNKDREVTGCQCGFAADTDSDCGWGDSVAAHLLDVGAEHARPAHYREAAAELLAKVAADEAAGSPPEQADFLAGIRYAADMLDLSVRPTEEAT